MVALRAPAISWAVLLVGCGGASATSPASQSVAVSTATVPASCADATPGLRERPGPAPEAFRLLDGMGETPSEAQLDQTLRRCRAIRARRDANAIERAAAAYAVGWVLQAQNRLEEALPAFRDAVELDPELAEAAYRLGEVNGTLGRDDESLEWLRRATELEPGYVIAHFNAGQVAYRMRRYDDALASFRCAAHLEPEDSLAVRKVVQALHALGRFEEAIEPRARALAMYQQSPDPNLPGIVIVIDQLVVDGFELVVVEVAPPRSTDDELAYLFLAYVRRDGANRFVVNLESSAVLREQGVAAIVGGMLPDGSHFTTRVAFETTPTYEAYRPRLVAVVQALLRGESVAGASSRSQ